MTGKLRLGLAAAASAVALVAGAGVSSAGVAGAYGYVWNSGLSTCYVDVYNQAGQPGVRLAPGKATSNYIGWDHKARYFRIQSGCKGSYGGNSPFNLKGGVSYWTYGNSVVIRAVKGTASA